VEQVGVDAAIIFSDILVVPQAMGMVVEMVEGKGPFLPEPVKRFSDLSRLHSEDANEKLAYVFDALKLTKQTLANRVPLIGFAGSPWTLLCYMVQGKGSKTFDEAKAFCFTDPGTAHKLLQMITDTTIAYLKEQVKAGADVVQLFDSWGGLLSPKDFEEYSLQYLRQIIDALKEEVLTIIFSKGAWFALEEIVATGVNGIGLDWCIKPQLARKITGPTVTLQGNLDPARLLSPVPVIKKEVRKMLNAFGGQRHIANLGHGILPNTPLDHARAFVDTVKEWSGRSVANSE
jgi:uroporphyrinogen decarboxylase